MYRLAMYVSDKKPEEVEEILPPDDQEERVQERRYILSDIRIPLRKEVELELNQRRRTFARDEYQTSKSDSMLMNGENMWSNGADLGVDARDERSQPRELINISNMRGTRRTGVSHPAGYVIARAARGPDQNEVDFVQKSYDRLRLERTFVAREANRDNNPTKVYFNRTSSGRMLRHSRSSSSLPVVSSLTRQENKDGGSKPTVEPMDSGQSLAIGAKSKRGGW